MLNNNITNFLQYCKTCGFKKRSLEAFSSRLKQFNNFVQTLSIKSIKEITYDHLLQFVTEYEYCSQVIKKQRIWALHQFYHFLKLNKIVDKNIALSLPYPKIEKKVPHYLTISEFNCILKYFTLNSNSRIGIRNLILIMMLGYLGLRTSAIISLNIEDVDIKENKIWVLEKGGRKRIMFMPKILGKYLSNYIKMLAVKKGPLFLSKRKQRMSDRTLQNLFRQSADKFGIDKKLHPHLFRHTAATHLNQVAGVAITQYVLGHARRKNTQQYTHLNPDIYAAHMKKHPYMNL